LIWRSRWFAGAYGTQGDAIPQGAVEFTNWKGFRKALEDNTDTDHARYRLLDLAAYAEKEGEQTLPLVNGDSQKIKISRFTGNPNQQMFADVHSVTMQRMATEIRALPGYSSYKFAIYGALANCDSESFLPKVVYRRLMARLKAATKSGRGFRAETVLGYMKQGLSVSEAFAKDAIVYYANYNGSGLRTSSPLSGYYERYRNGEMSGKYTELSGFSSNLSGVNALGNLIFYGSSDQTIPATSPQWHYPEIGKMRFLVDLLKSTNPDQWESAQWSSVRYFGGNTYLFGDGNKKTILDVLPLLAPDVGAPRDCTTLKEKSLDALE
jgi:hypothetical protein